MIDVNLTPFAKNLLGVSFGVIAFNQAQNKKQLDAVIKQQQAVAESKKQFELWDDINYQITVEMIDKRFKSSQAFRESRIVEKPLQMRKRTTEEQTRIKELSEMMMMKSKNHYKKTQSVYNQKLLDQKLKSQSRNLDLASLRKMI